MSTITLERDWLGIKNMHYLLDENTLLMGNTIKSLMKSKAYDFSNVKTVRSGCKDKINLETGEIVTERYYKLPENIIYGPPEIASKNLRETLESTKTDSLDGVTAVMLSGGIDSIIAAYLSKQVNKQIVCYTLTVKGYESADSDVGFAKNAAEAMDLPLVVVKVSPDEVRKSVNDTIYTAEDFRDYNIYSAIGAYLLGKRMAKDGHKKVACGEGPDEIFGSYDPWGNHSLDSDSAKKPESRRKFVKNLEWNLTRGTKVLGSFGIDAVSPYLVKDFVEYCVNLDEKTVNIHGHRKGILAEAFKDVLPIGILLRSKIRFQDGTGITQVLRNAKIDNDYIKKVFDSYFKSSRLS